MIEQFTNRYPISKTLRFKLIPQGKTAENFDKKLLLEEDEQRAKAYSEVKKMIDRYHKKYIEDSLQVFELALLDEYAALYYKHGRELADTAEMNAISAKMRKQISKQLTSQPEYKGLFGKELITQYLPRFVGDDELETVEMFSSFTTYFTGFHENRKNMYSGEGKSTEIAFRIVDQNLPKFLDNVKNGKYAIASFDEEDVAALAADIAEAFGTDLLTIFNVEYFNCVLTQTGIDKYNQIIGGFTTADGRKIKGINEYINLHNQTSDKKLPMLKALYKQILSDRSSISFIPEKFESDTHLLSTVNSFFCGEQSGLDLVSEMGKLLSHIPEFDLSGIYVANGAAVTNLSNAVFGSWSTIQRGFDADYDAVNMKKTPKDIEAYEKKRRDYFKKNESYSVAVLQAAGEKNWEDAPELTIAEYLASEGVCLASEVSAAYAKAKQLLESGYPEGKKLCANDDDIELIKRLLDAAKDLQSFAKPLCGSGKEESKDDLFYGEFAPLYERLEDIIPLYNMVRNYVTQKPYSDDKIKLNFNNALLLAGWDVNKETDCSAVLFTKGSNYFVGIMSKDSRRSFEAIPEAKDGEEVYHKMVYKLLPGPNKMLPKVFFSRKGLETFTPDAEIMRIYESGSFKKGDGFSLGDCHKLIDFYKDSIEKYPGWDVFGFDFTPTERYRDVGEFYKEIKDQGYKISFVDVPESYIDRLVDEGKLYLFKIYNKDFSEYSKGTPNLHTMYFKMLFDEANLATTVFALNGGAEMFYRKPSISKKDATVHPANQPVKNKNPLNDKKDSTFGYDIIKDRRYTERQFSLHVPITLNFSAPDVGGINYDVRRALCDAEESYVIGIDRGERNLLYACVIDGSGKIVEQRSLNVIDSGKQRVDYHDLLGKKEEERTKARKDWKTINNISNLKEGYIGQAVHIICELVEKYDAVIAMEDLNSGFKNSRVKVEKQVYQKFEKMLIDKLNFFADKKKSPDEVGGLLNAYQLTNRFESFAKMGKQNGIIFYIPAWLTSKIDPTTGFVDLLKPRYESVEKSKAFIRNVDRVEYNAERGWFEFDIDYGKFPKGVTDYRRKWTLCSCGKRIKTFRSEADNNQFVSREIDLTEEFRKLFTQYGIDSAGDIKAQVLCLNDKAFFAHFMKLMSLMLQLRNSMTGTDIDYLASPVMNSEGRFYNSNDYSGENAALPSDADANGAYHIARKAQWAIEQIKSCKDGDLFKASLAISNAEWLEYIQSQF